MITALTCRNLSAGYGGILACRDIDLDVHSGQVTVVTGPNGAGKTTLIRRIAGQVRGGGQIQLDGREIGNLATHKRAQLGLLTVPEGRGLVVDLSVRENIELASLMLPHAERADAFDKAVERFPVLADRGDLSAGALSGGEQQMLAMARVLVLEPKVLLLDEPSQGLAPVIVEEVARAVEVLQAKGTAVLLVEQHLGLARRLADSAIVLVGGEIRMRGTAAELLDEDLLADAYLEVGTTRHEGSGTDVGSAGSAPSGRSAGNGPPGSTQQSNSMTTKRERS